MEPPSALNSALRLLARREHSKHELRKKLLAKDIPQEEVDKAIERLAAENLQNDRRFASSSIRMRAGMGHGPNRIRAELGQHDLDEGIAVDAMEDVEVDWLENARQILIRRYGTGELDFKTRNKAITFLMQRGFSMDMAREAMSTRSEDLE